MILDTIEVQDRYYRNPDGSIRQETWIGNRCISRNNNAPVVFIDWSTIETIWTRMVKLPTALVKEGPKAIVKWREP